MKTQKDGLNMNRAETIVDNKNISTNIFCCRVVVDPIWPNVRACNTGFDTVAQECNSDAVSREEETQCFN